MDTVRGFAKLNSCILVRSEQFDVEVIPAMVNLYPEASSGGADSAFLAPDCYHQNAELPSMVMIGFYSFLDNLSSDWQEYLEQSGRKVRSENF